VRRVKEKRDAVVAFLRHCESQQEFADAEIERIQKRRAFIARAQEELESCLIPVVEAGWQFLELANPAKSRVGTCFRY